MAFKSCVSFWFLRNSLLFQNLAGFEYFQTKEIALCSVCRREPWDVLEDRRNKWDLDPGIVHLEIGRPGLTECTSVSNIQTNQILMTKQSKEVPTFSNMNLFFSLIFIYWAVLGLCCGRSTLFPWSGITPGPSALGAQSLHHWTTSEVPLIWYFAFQTESTVFMGKSRFFQTLCTPILWFTIDVSYMGELCR